MVGGVIRCSKGASECILWALSLAPRVHAAGIEDALRVEAVLHPGGEGGQARRLRLEHGDAAAPVFIRHHQGGVAAGMGVEAGRATSAEEFNRLLKAGLDCQGPYLIEAVL